MNKQLHNELSDAQLDAISGGCHKRYCDDDYKRDCDYDRDDKKSRKDRDYDYNYCEPHKKHRSHCY